MKYTQLSVSRVRRASVDEKKDRRKGRFLAFFLHLGMAALAIWPFLYELPEKRTADIQVIMVDFREPPQQTSGSSREGASAPAKSGIESEVEPVPVPVEEVIPPTPEPEPTPVEPEPEPQPEPEPEPVPITPIPQPELVTTTEPEPVRIPPVPPSPPAPAPEPEIEQAPTPPQAPPQPKVEEEAPPEPEKRKPLNERIADFFKDNEYSGKDEEGSGSGSTPEQKDGPNDGNSTNGTSGTGETGDGDSDSGNRANGSGDGWVEGMGKLSRIKISSPPISDLVKEVGRVVVKVCINKRGAVIYSEYDTENSTLKDIGHQQRALEHVKKIVFERKDNAPDRECGRLTFRMIREGEFEKSE